MSKNNIENKNYVGIFESKISEELEEKILNLAVNDTDSGIFLIINNYLPVKYISSEIYAEILKVLKSFFEKYNAIPTKSIVYNVTIKLLEKKNNREFTLEEKNNIKEKIDRIYEKNYINPSEREFLISEIETYIKRQKMKEAILKAVDFLEKNDFDKIEKIITETAKFSVNINIKNMIDISDTKSIDQRYLYFLKSEDIIPTFLPTLNSYLEGGLHRGELNIIMSASGFGKTTFLLNQAIYSFKNNLNVLYITCELSEKQIAYRIDKNILRMTSEEIKKNVPEIKNKYQNIFQTVNSKIIIIYQPAYTTKKSDIIKIIEDLKKYDFEPDIIIVDYLELLQCTGYMNMKEYERQGVISADLRNIAVEKKCTVLTATQTNRKVFDIDKEDEEIAEQQVIGESINKVKITDTLFLLLQTKTEQAQNYGRIRVVKNRHGRTNVDIPVSLHYDIHLIEEKLF